MNEPEKIVIGYSLPKSVMLGSTEYTSKTSCKKEKDGEVIFKNTITKRSAVPDFLNKKWMPKTLTFIIDLYKKPENKSDIITNIWSAVCIITTIYFLWIYKSSEIENGDFLRRSIESLLGISMFFIFVNVFVSKWHAAEHMAFACYNDIKSFEPSDIRKYSRVDPHCGSRIFVLMFITLTLYRALLSKYIPNVHPLLEMIVFFELTMYYDKYVGIIRTPILREITFWLQKHILTKEPDDLQIETASLSVFFLILAHRQREESHVKSFKRSASP
jgi:uncharacterized protein YqhQ